MTRREAIANWGVYALTDREMAGGRTHTDIGEQLIAGGVRVIQVRDKTTPFEELLEDTRHLVALAHPRQVMIIVNDNPYLARESDADGVHLGQTDFPVAIARSIVGPDCLIGLSTHTPLQALRAQGQGADYIGLGPIFPTQTKEAGHFPLGLDVVRWAARTLRVPFVAIGGITAETFPDVMAAGARHCAMVSALMKSNDLAATARYFVQLCNQMWQDDELH
ncbi:thiamine phosphate synthase [Candidatus Sumerlaeota bacterium]|nr:thiamine phosphate synthase [Candidatus Sumerlaeota bacterium]